MVSFDCLIWRSLHNSPTLTDLLNSILSEHSAQEAISPPKTVDAQIEQLMTYLREQQCFLVLDGFEAVLQSGQLGGRYRSDYQGYGQLLNQIITQPHQSCILITSREKPMGLPLAEGQSSAVRSLHLKGLSAAETHTLLTAKNLTVSQSEAEQLCMQYGGNPFALNAVAASVQTLFARDVSMWFSHGTLLFDEIEQLLEQQFQRLSVVEQRFIFWLAMQQDWVNWEAIQDAMVHRGKLSAASVLEILKSLQGRSLIETNASGFNLQPYLKQYVQERLITQALSKTEPQRAIIVLMQNLPQQIFRVLLQYSEDKSPTFRSDRLIY